MIVRSIVITGASSGIGAALAMRLTADGHNVALAARREPELHDVAKRAGVNAIAVRTDVTRRSDVNQLRDRAIDAFGHIDVWINNAGRGITRPVIDRSEEHTSELQSRNDISYAVFCLKKKK